MPADTLGLFRRFRHDLLNELQILSGHLQLGRPTEVLRQDVQAVTDRITEISRIFSCRNDPLAVALWDWLERAREQEISFSFDVVELPRALSVNHLDCASRLVIGLLPQIVALEEEERWMHVAVDPAGVLQLTVPVMPVEDLLADFPQLRDGFSSGCDGEMEFMLQLLPDQS